MGNLDLLEDACAALSHTKRAMFGGHGLFAPNGGMFAAIVDDDRIVLKLAQEAPRAELIELGGAPWAYAGTTTMKDWIVVPDAFYDEPRTLAEWARRAHALAPPKKAKAPKKAAAKKAGAKKAGAKKARARKPSAKKGASPKRARR